MDEGLALAEPHRWLELFTQGFAGTGFYRPLMALSLSIDASLSNTQWLFHAATLGWHAAASMTTQVWRQFRQHG